MHRLMTDRGETRLTGLSGLRWIQADVFSDRPISGNGLAVFLEAGGLSAAMMLRLTQELRQFESIFLEGTPADDPIRARIFTAEEELDFAGHPVLGAAAVLQHLADTREDCTWRISLRSGEVTVETRHRERGFLAEMDQGLASFGSDVTPAAAAAVLEGLGLGLDALAAGYPLATVSTGLPYLILPVTAAALAEGRIRCTDFEQRLRALGAKFLYLFDPEAREGRSWDNLGLVEDIATGSAAGPAAAYLWRYGRVPDQFVIRQGRFTGRPSEISVRRDPASGSVLVSGGVAILAEGRFY